MNVCCILSSLKELWPLSEVRLAGSLISFITDTLLWSYVFYKLNSYSCFLAYLGVNISASMLLSVQTEFEGERQNMLLYEAFWCLVFKWLVRKYGFVSIWLPFSYEVSVSQQEQATENSSFSVSYLHKTGGNVLCCLRNTGV